MPPRPAPTSSTADRQRRNSILRAAVVAFGRHGFNGARTNLIAKDAGVNIALVFYYFKDKEKLYRAALEEVLKEWTGRLRDALDSATGSEAKLHAYVHAAFDFLAEEPARARLVQLEILQDSSRIAPLLRKYVQPVRNTFRQAVAKGIRSGEFRAADPEETLTSIFGVIVSHFNNAGATHTLTGRNPFSAASIERRRIAVLEFISRAVQTRPPKAAQRGRR